MRELTRSAADGKSRALGGEKAVKTARTTAEGSRFDCEASAAETDRKPAAFAPGGSISFVVGSWKSARCLRASRSLLKSSRFLFRDNAVYSLGTVHTGRSHLDMATSKQRRRNKFRGQSLEVHSGRRGVVLPQMPAVAPPGARRGHRGFGSQARVVRGPTSPQIQPLSCTRRTFQQAAGQRFLDAAVTGKQEQHSSRRFG